MRLHPLIGAAICVMLTLIMFHTGHYFAALFLLVFAILLVGLWKV